MADDFLTTYAPLANDIADHTGLNPATVLGIIDTETGHGQHVLGNNIFGISPGGRVAAYPDVQTASQAFVSLMRQPNYAPAATATDPAAQAQLLVKGGYNTVNPKYAQTVAANAQSAVKQLGYQDGTGGAQGGDQTAAPDYNNPAPAPAPAAPAAPAKATAGSDADFLQRTGAAVGGGAKQDDPDAAFLTRTGAVPATTTKTDETTKPDDFGTFSPEGVYVPAGTVPAQGPPGASLPTKQDIVNALQPDPNMIYGSPIDQSLPMGGNPLGAMFSPFARDPKTGDTHLTLPPAIRSVLLGLAGGVGPQAMTYDPKTGTLNLTEEAQAAASLGVHGLRFSGKNPLQFEPPGMLERSPIPAADAASILNPDAAARVRAAQGGPVQVPPPTVPTPFNTPPTGPTSLPTGVPVTRLAEPLAPPVSGGAAPVLSPGDHQWAGGMRDRLAEIQQENQEAGIPGSVGAAATPQQLAQLTPAQMKAYRAQAELGEILRPPEPGMDRSVYVHGSEPTLAEYSGDPDVSQKESFTRERDPNAWNARLKTNNQARVNSYEDEMGTQPQLQDLRDNKSLAAEKDGAAYVQAARPLDMTPQLEWLNKQLSDPRIQQSPSRMKVLGELRDALFDADGKLKTDPNAGWGIHDDLIDRLDKSGDRTAAERYAQKQLVEYKRIVDGVNNTASDGAFQKFLDNQTSFAQRINSMEELQKFHTRLTNRTGDINGNAFHKFVADLAARRARPGVDPAMGISDDTMHALIGIDKDLKRATNIDLGKSRGSQTNLFGALAQATGIGLAHAGALAISHGNPTANLFLQGALGTAHKMTGNVLLRRATKRGLAPPPGGFDYNPLIRPSAPP